jgi:hypothetical protein
VECRYRYRHHRSGGESVTHTRTYQILVSSGYLGDTRVRYRIVTAYVLVYPDGSVLTQAQVDWHCYQHRCRVSDLTGQGVAYVCPTVYERIY